MLIGTQKEILDAISKHDNIVIFHHIRPDGDCLGSQAGLYSIIKNNYPSKKVYSVGNNYNSYPFLDWNFNDLNSIDMTNSLAIAVDVSDLSRIELSDFFDSNKFTSRARIDHHNVEKNDYFQYSWVDSEAAAAGEMVAQFAKDNNFKIDNDAAQKLYLSVMTDSGRYMYSGNRVETQLIGSWLLNYNFDATNLYNNLYKKSLSSIKFNGYITSNFEIDKNVLYFEVNPENSAKFGLNTEEATRFINSLANIEDYSIWVFFTKMENGESRVEVRSNGPSVVEVCKAFGGGGHPRACGAPISTYYKEKQEILKSLNNLTK
ncbi:phosphoesterase RecJ-like protein [Mycoplasma testudineum]|uniref:Phosphoesterase RecJ-like protein n=1 Tax=Mycoplasma testudineum TaxID=244584 RepID=A0A4R6IG12_9MOLU|nr:bifunctional oligoribonuclease/PAP phosphatase NrnA [Mycoplasma testudineum]TDO19875.1 phosphoesterase RecJ-like protein [Mycoplasma testudineum]